MSVARIAVGLVQRRAEQFTRRRRFPSRLVSDHFALLSNLSSEIGRFRFTHRWTMTVSIIN
jgi:hypothetical protein